jgi:hypothetical protein
LPCRFDRPFAGAGAPLAAAGLITVLAACSSGGMAGGTLPPPSLTITSQTAPPPAKAESVPPVPAAQTPEYFIWEPGHWHWTGQGYVWIPGSYIERPYPSAVWVHGGWTENGLTWTWTPGHWS